MTSEPIIPPLGERPKPIQPFFFIYFRERKRVCVCGVCYLILLPRVMKKQATKKKPEKNTHNHFKTTMFLFFVCCSYTKKNFSPSLFTKKMKIKIKTISGNIHTKMHALRTFIVTPVQGVSICKLGGVGKFSIPVVNGGKHSRDWGTFNRMLDIRGAFCLFLYYDYYYWMDGISIFIF